MTELIVADIPGPGYVRIMDGIRAGCSLARVRHRGDRVLAELPGCRLAWSDEFDGPAGSPPAPGTWQPQTGGHGWGNRQLQYYTAGAENAALDGAGHLAIVVERVAPQDRGRYGGCEYTSARLTTKDRLSVRYGVAQARMQIPAGQGMWPAFWMMGQDFDGVGWPRCGELDVMENFGTDPRMVYGAAHGPGYTGAAITATRRARTSLADGFHVYSVVWEPARIRWYLDGRRYATVTPADLEGRPWVFGHDFFLLLNVAVGGTASVTPGPSATFPQRLLVDYIRVYAAGDGSLGAVTARRARAASPASGGTSTLRPTGSCCSTSAARAAACRTPATRPPAWTRTRPAT